MAYNFHYTPTGTGVISGKEVLEQTEDAINDLGNTAISGVQEALDKAEQALTNSENAVDDAQTALNTANNAEGVAIQAQTDVGNLSGTVANIGNRVTTAEGNITNLQGRMTTAEGNITNLQGRMTTAETNIGNLQTAVSTAQATANSAQQTANTARQQSYVLRYSSSSVTDNSTIAYSTIDNTDNIKVNDKIIDVDGKIFSVVSVDTANQTVTVGSALIDLALDSNVVHTSGNETVGGAKTFTSVIKGYNSDSTQNTVSIDLRTSKVARGSTSDGTENFGIGFKDKANVALASINCIKRSTGGISEYHTIYSTDSDNNVLSESLSFNLGKDGTCAFRAETNNKIILGTSSNRWKDVQTNQINGLTPSSLGMPDLSNRIDISGYITNLNGSYNAYTPSVDGWIAVQSSDATFIRIADTGSGGLGNTTTSQTAGILTCMMPVRANRQHNIYIVCTTLSSAYFIPCQGNV